MKPNGMDEIEHPHWDTHARGDRHCADCTTGFPRDCRCGGLVHGEVVQVPGDGFVQLTRCERCGEPDR